jgi:hypothetical protein
MHPLITNLASFKDAELDLKVNDLTKKYFVTENYELRNQISLVIDTYKAEIEVRRQKEWQNMMESRNKDLDKLINIS